MAITFYSGLRFWNFLAHRDRRDVIYNAAPTVFLKAFIARPPPGSRPLSALAVSDGEVWGELRRRPPRCAAVCIAVALRIAVAYALHLAMRERYGDMKDVASFQKHRWSMSESPGVRLYADFSDFW